MFGEEGGTFDWYDCNFSWSQQKWTNHCSQVVRCCLLLVIPPPLHSQVHKVLGDFPCFPGADYHPVHWLPRPNLLLLLCLPGGKGRCGWGGQNRLLQLCWRPVVGSGKTLLLVLLWKTDFHVGCAAQSRSFLTKQTMVVIWSRSSKWIQ